MIVQNHGDDLAFGGARMRVRVFRRALIMVCTGAGEYAWGHTARETTGRQFSILCYRSACNKRTPFDRTTNTEKKTGSCAGLFFARGNFAI